MESAEPVHINDLAIAVRDARDPVEANRAATELLHRLNPILHNLCNQSPNRFDDKDDRLQIARIRAVEACKTFDPKRGNYLAYMGIQIQRVLWTRYKMTRQVGQDTRRVTSFVSGEDESDEFNVYLADPDSNTEARRIDARDEIQLREAKLLPMLSLIERQVYDCAKARIYARASYIDAADLMLRRYGVKVNKKLIDNAIQRIRAKAAQIDKNK